MKKDMKKFKDLYLDELTSTDDLKEQIKNKIGIKREEKPINESKNSFFVNKRKPLIFGGSFVLLVLIAIVSVVSIISYRNTPVYQGMDADNMPIVRNTNRNIRYKDHEDYTNNKYDDKFDKLVEDVETQIGIIVDDRIVCYAQPGETIIITVQIDNPKFFEILSFTLNGTLYQTYQFEDGSDSSQIKVKFTVQETSGLQEITIDAIKYVDDTTIKNVRFGAEKTIKLGVTYQNVPQVIGVNEINNASNYAISFTVDDLDQLININNGLNIYLFDQETLVSSTKLNLGMNLIPYSNLKLGTTYAYVIMGVYDLYDGAGKKAYVLHQNTFTTQEGVTYNTFESTYDSISVTYNKLEGVQTSISEVKVYLGDELVQTITEGLDNVVINNLLSNNEYRIDTTYKYVLTENNSFVEYSQTISDVYKTLERPIPTLGFVNESLTQNSISFEYNILDSTTLGKITKVEMYNKDELIQTYEGSVSSFTELLSDNDYKFVVSYEYDLLDGNGVNISTFEVTYHTIKKTVPTAVITQAVPMFGNLYVWFEVEDIDGIIEIISVDLLSNNEIVKSVTEFANYNENPNNKGFFSGDFMLSGLASGEYTLVIKYQYDMHDGNPKVLVDENHPTADNKLGLTVN